MNKRGEAVTALVIIGLLALGAYTILTVSSNSPTGLAGFQTAATGCTTINQSDNLTANVSFNSSGVCFRINQSNVVFDCLGNTIYFNRTAITASAVFDVHNLENITIQNCRIVLSTSGGGITAVFPAVNFTNVSNSTIFNNTIISNATSGSTVSIISVTRGQNNTISNNTISTSLNVSTLRAGIGLNSGSNNSRILFNNLTIAGTSGSQIEGLILVDSTTTGNVIDSNLVTGVSGSVGGSPNGIVVNGARNVNITNNNVTLNATSISGISGIGLNGGTINATLINNRVRINATTINNRAVRIFQGANNTLFSNNIIELNGSSSTNGLAFITSGTLNNLSIVNNTFRYFSGFSALLITSESGIVVSNATITNNTFILEGTASGTPVGISFNNIINSTIYNNTFNTSSGISVSGDLVNVFNNTCYNTTGRGIENAASNSITHNNMVISDPVNGFSSGMIFAAENSTYTNNTIISRFFGSTGIEVGGTNGTATNNTLINSSISMTGTGGFAFNNTLNEGFLDLQGSSNSLFENSMTYNAISSATLAIRIQSGSSNNISNHSIQLNTNLTDVYAIDITGGSSNIIRNTSVNLNASSNSATIRLSSSSTGNLITDTPIFTNTSSAIILSDSSGNNFTNIILNNTPSWIDSTDTGAGSTNNFTNITFVVSGQGQVFFPNFTVSNNSNVTRTTLNISGDRIFLNSTNLSGMNQTAQITLLNATVANVQADFEDDGTFVNCGAVCNITTIALPTLIFNVTHFTTFQSSVGGINVTVTKTDSPDPVTPGSQLNYTIVVNVTSGTAINVTVNETYPSGVTFHNSSPSPNVSNNIFFLGNLTGPAVAQINITVNVSANASGILVNTINVSYQNDTGGNISINLSENTTVVSINQTIVVVTKTDSPDPVNNGSQLNYTINLTVTQGNATNVTVVDTYPSDVVFDSATPAPSAGNNTFNLSNLTNGTSILINITVNVSANASGTLVNNVNVTFENITNQTNSVTASASTTVNTGVSPATSGSGGGSGGSGGVICPPLCRYPENANLPVCRTNCPQSAQTTPPQSQLPLAAAPSLAGQESNAEKLGDSAAFAQGELDQEQTEQVSEELSQEKIELRKRTSTWPWLLLLLLIALIIMATQLRKRTQLIKPTNQQHITQKREVKLNNIDSKETHKILENIKKSEERLKKLLGK